MTDSELQALILGDPTAKQLAENGADDRCAERCREIATPELAEHRLDELGIIGLYPNPSDAETVLSTVEGVAVSNPLVARVVKWLQPGATGVDFGNLQVRALLTADIPSGGVGLSQTLAEPLLKSAERQPTITGHDVARLGLFTP